MAFDVNYFRKFGKTQLTHTCSQLDKLVSQETFICLKSTIETLIKGVKYVQS